MKLPELDPISPQEVKQFSTDVFWGVADREQLIQFLSANREFFAPGVHFSDNFLTWGRNNSMLEDATFVKSWQSNCESVSDQGIVWRRYVLACAAFHCVQLPGDFVECGCYTGVGVKTIVDYLGGAEFPKQFWAYDIFEHSADMENHAMPEHGDGLYEKVIEKFKPYPQVNIVKGLIPEAFEGQSPEKISYLHIDLNQATAELAALEALFERVVPGGIVILDDYEWAGVYRPQKMAEDPWFQARGYRVMPLPTGQGLVIKR